MIYNNSYSKKEWEKSKEKVSKLKIIYIINKYSIITSSSCSKDNGLNMNLITLFYIFWLSDIESV